MINLRFSIAPFLVYCNSIKKYRLKTKIMLLILFTSAVILNSCKRDFDPPEVENIVSQSEIQDAKKWYNTFTYGKRQKATIFNPKLVELTAENSDQKIPELDVDWSNAVTMKVGEKTIVEVPVNGDFGFSTDSEKYNKDNPNPTTSLVILTNSKSRAAYFMSVVSKADYKEKVTYLKQPRSFNGSLIYHSLQGQLIVVQNFKDGAVIGIGAPAINTKSVSTKAPDMGINSEAPIYCNTYPLYNNYSNCVDGTGDCHYYSEYVGSYTLCTGGGYGGPGGGGGPGSGGGGGGGGSGSTPNPNPPIPCIPANASSLGPIPMAYGYGVNSEPPIGNPEDPAPEPDPCAPYFVGKIKNNVTDSCISDAINRALTIKTEIREMLNSTFTGTTTYDYDMNFHERTNFPDDLDGTSRQSNAFTFELSFNKNTLPQKSREYILATVYHEILHAFLSAKYPAVSGQLQIPEDHTEMANNYILLLTTSLKTAYPNIDESEAWALSWGGLQDTPFYNGLLNSAQKTFIVSVNERHRKSATNRSGTYCN